MAKRRLILLLFLVGGLAGAAEDRERARAAFKAGNQHYNLGELKEALESFKEAYRNYEHPTFLFNIGQCERQLGQKREALRTYRAYLNASHDASNGAMVHEIIAQLERDLKAEAERPSPPAVVAPPAAAPPPAVVAPPPVAARAAVAPPLVSTPEIVKRRPAYKKPWVWVVVGGVVVAAAATGLAVGLTRNQTPSATTSLGVVHPF